MRFFRLAMLVMLIGIWLPGCELNKEYKPVSTRDIIQEVRKKHRVNKRTAVFEVGFREMESQIHLMGEVSDPAAKEELIALYKKEFPHHQIDDKITVLPGPDFGPETFGVIRNSVASQYRQARYGSELINQGLMGMELRLLRKEEGWFYVQMPDGYLGWMPGGCFSRGDKTWLEAWRSKPKVVLERLFDTIREKPAVDSAVVGDVVRGVRLIRLGEKQSWVEVETPDGRKGFLERIALIEESALSARKPTGEDLEKTAREMLGFPYLWGGASVKGLDCSGFTSSVYRFHNVILPRDADMQGNAGKELELDAGLTKLQKGDLLFFGKSMEEITHVGMYLGEGRYIHSSGSVRINSLREGAADFDADRKNTLRKARRFL